MVTLDIPVYAGTKAVDIATSARVFGISGNAYIKLTVDIFNYRWLQVESELVLYVSGPSEYLSLDVLLAFIVELDPAA